MDLIFHDMILKTYNSIDFVSDVVFLLRYPVGTQILWVCTTRQDLTW